MVALSSATHLLTNGEIQDNRGWSSTKIWNFTLPQICISYSCFTNGETMTANPDQKSYIWSQWQITDVKPYPSSCQPFNLGTCLTSKKYMRVKLTRKNLYRPHNASCLFFGFWSWNHPASIQLWRFLSVQNTIGSRKSLTHLISMSFQHLSCGHTFFF